MGLLVAVVVVMPMVVTVVAVGAMHMRFDLHCHRNTAQGSRRLGRVVMAMIVTIMRMIMSRFRIPPFFGRFRVTTRAE